MHFHRGLTGVVPVNFKGDFFEETEKAKSLAQLGRFLRDKLSLSWLPLLRVRSNVPMVSLDLDDDVEESYDTGDPLNNKISDLISQITRYFAVLDSRASSETKIFEKEYLLSLLNFQPSDKPVFEQDSRSSYDSQKQRMHDIFIELGLEEEQFKSTLDTHFSRVRAAARRLGESKDATVPLDDYFVLADTLRLHDIVQKYQNYEEKKSSIFEPKSRFSKLMNDLLLNKQFLFSESNQPVIIGKIDHSMMNVYDLSSGERQIFVLLSETLLQENRRHVFIADEPELSLHIEWQSSLVQNIRQLNSNCQIIFATHSPDLVSIFQDRVVNFDEL